MPLCLKKYASVLVASILLISIYISTMGGVAYLEDSLQQYGQTKASYTVENITQDPKWQILSSIHGGNIVWEDYRNDFYGSWSSPGLRNSDIYLYNISREETIQLTSHESSQSKPDIWRNYVVWEDYRNGNADIYYLDLLDDTLTPHQVTDNDKKQISPKIHDGRIVWVDYRSGSFGDIYMYDIFEEETYVLSDIRAPKSTPDIHGDKVVWTDYRNYWYYGIYDAFIADIFMYDLTVDSDNDGTPNYKDVDTPDEDPAEIGVVEEKVHQHDPSIFENKIAWIEYQNKNNDIFMKTVGENKTEVSAESSVEEFPKIYGGRIVYNERNYDGEQHTHDTIWLYDIYDETKEKIAEVEQDPEENDGVLARYPCIFKDRIVWEERHPSSLENLTYQYDIYYAELGTEGPEVSDSYLSLSTGEEAVQANMTLLEGIYFEVYSTVKDIDGDLKRVYFESDEFELEGLDNSLNLVGTDRYKKRIEYDVNMTAGVYNFTVHAEDSEGNTATGAKLTLELIENEPVIHSFQVGLSETNLTQEVTYYLEPGNDLYFVGNASDEDGDISETLLLINGDNISEIQLDMAKVTNKSNTYQYHMEYDEGMQPGNYTAVFSVTDSRENLVNSSEVIIRAQYRPEDDNGDDNETDDNGTLDDNFLSNPLFYILLIALIIVIIAIFIVLKTGKNLYLGKEGKIEEEPEDEPEEDTDDDVVTEESIDDIEPEEDISDEV
ncbi:MAG: hypothetical protein R6U61_03010 [Thermoplasmata archaeon]